MYWNYLCVNVIIITMKTFNKYLFCKKKQIFIDNIMRFEL